MTSSKHSRAWWGQYETPPGQGRRWIVGPLELTASWRPPEWRLTWCQVGERTDGEVEIAPPVAADALAAGEGAHVLRAMSADSAGVVSLAPCAADRPLVVRPETPIAVLPGARASLFLSTPVWICVSVGVPPGEVLDVPSWRLSDTWFGPTTQRGELCYAVRTSARLNLANLPSRGHRVITEVLLDNRDDESFFLERLSLPAAHLALYADADAQLWTQAVQVTVRGQGKLAEIDLGQGPPQAAREPEMVAEPRVPVSRNIAERAFSALFA